MIRAVRKPHLPTMTPASKQYGRFVVDEELGRGGMGVVYRAEDPVIGRSVAIKVLHPDPSLSPKARGELQTRFEQEFRSAGNLIHPSLVTVYDVGQEADESFIAMECVEGESLEAMLRSGKELSFKEVSELAERLCSGLDYAHDAGIVHRDIKPANVLLTDSGRPKITDFGVAKVRSANLTLTGTVVGTPAYMAPEQILGEPITGAADQFSVGVILYQILTGELPFIGDLPTTTLYKIVHEDPKPPSEVNPTLPVEVDAPLLRALSKKASDRYPACTDLAKALRDALGTTPHISAESANRTVTLSGAQPFDAEIAHAGSGSYGGAVTWANHKPTPRYGLLAFGAIVVAMLGWFGAEKVFERTQGGQTDELAATDGESPDGEEVETDAEGGAADAEASAQQETAPSSAASGVVEPAEAPPPLPVTLMLSSQPAGARVVLDGEPLANVTPLLIDLVPEQEFELALELDGYKPASIRAMPSDYDEQISFTLEKKIVYGAATLSAPYPVVLRSGGQRSDMARDARLRLAPGRHEVAITAPSVFLERVVTIDVGDGEEVALPQLPATVSIRLASIPGNSRVYIDGQFVDEAPVSQDLTLGSSHELRFEWPDGTQKIEQHRIERDTTRIVVAKD